MSATDAFQRARAAAVAERDRALEAPVHDERTAASLGAALGLSFTVCFVTGLISHQVQHPAAWFHWPPRPAGLYRFTQGLHVATGLASIPLLLAKLWSVFPHLVQWPPIRSFAHALERLMLFPLVCGSVFLLFSGAANIAHWYPWRFSFTRTHYWVAWMTIGAMVAHIGAKFSVTRRQLSGPGRAQGVTSATADLPRAGEGTLSRRGYLAWTAAGVALVTATTVGQTVRPLRQLALFAPRRPDRGPQGVPVNGVPSADVKARATSPAYRLRVTGDVAEALVLTLDDLRAMPLHRASLPIACVEGWSAQGDWAGIPVRELLALAGVDPRARVEVRVDSLQEGSAYSHSLLDNDQARDRDTLIALELNGGALHLDHGFPCRLITPNRPGVHQTKWVERLVVTVS